MRDSDSSCSLDDARSNRVSDPRERMNIQMTRNVQNNQSHIIHCDAENCVGSRNKATLV